MHTMRRNNTPKKNDFSLLKKLFGLSTVCFQIIDAGDGIIVLE